MRHVFLALALAAAIRPVTMKAQTAPSAPSVLTTKILAIGSLIAAISSDQMKTIMPNEVRATVELYFEGKIDQWWSRQDGKGVVFLLNMTSIEEADSMLGTLPLGVAKKMTFQLVPLGPLNPLHILLRDQAVK